MTTRNYEAMFILDNNAASADFEGTAGKVDEILQKHDATIVQKEKWDERKLAYEIKGHRRGTYYLVYFQAPPTALTPINEDLRLAETVLRHLVIALELPIDEHIAVRDAEREKLAEDSRKNALGGWGGGRRGPRVPEPKSESAKRPADAGDAKTTDAPKGADAAKTEAAKPEAAKPEAAKTEAAKPEAAKPEAAKTEDAKPEAAKPEAAKPEAATPEAAKTEAAPAATEEPKAGAPATDPATGSDDDSGESEETKTKEAAPQP